MTHYIVQYYENKAIENNDNTYKIYILIEYLEPLSKWIYENAMTVKYVKDIGTDMAEALKLCHVNNILHRDIKLENVFEHRNNRDGKIRYKLGVFGVSKYLEEMPLPMTAPELIGNVINTMMVDKNNDITSITIEIGIYDIGQQAFNGCSNLSKVEKLNGEKLINTIYVGKGS